MTIDRAAAGANASLAQAFAIAGVAWFGLVTAITLFAEPRDAVIFGAPAMTLSLLAGGDTRLIDVQPTHAIVRGTEPGFVRALYRNGAWLVLPARGRTCLDRTR